MDNLREIGENVSSVAGQGVEGYNTGRSHGQTAAGLLGQFDSHMNRANMDALGGRPHPHDIFVRKYATNKHAAQLADYYRRTTPAMGGPRTAAWYTHDYGVSVPGASGTEGQMALLRHVRRQHEHIQAIRESPEPRGAFHNADSTAADVRPGIHQPALEPVAPRELEPMRDLRDGPSPTPAFAREIRANAEGARQRVQAMSRRAQAAGPIGLGSIPGAPRPASAIPLGSIMPTVAQEGGFRPPGRAAPTPAAVPRRARPQAMAAGRPPRSAPAEVIEQGPPRPRNATRAGGVIEQGPTAPRPRVIEQGPTAPRPKQAARPRAQTSGKSLRSALSRY